VNSLVDVNNLLSLETGFSIGTYNLAKLAPPCVFRRCRLGETSEGVGRGALNLERLAVGLR
jgi:DNA/RNA-binding domain of Phe-tRNA-synthetase-like protein